MQPQASPLWTTNTTLGRKTGTWRDAIPEYRTLPSPCLATCPVNGHIANWIGQIHNKEYRAAWLTLIENNPFPAIAGRICHHPCETACNRQYLDESIAICALERLVGDMALEQAWPLPTPAADRDQQIAIVGAGPAGLSAAFQLRQHGFVVTVFEPQAQLGGLMRYGIPAYRLDKKVLDGEIQRILDLGINVERQAIATQQQLERLRARFDAIYLATGAARSKSMPVLNYTKPWVVDAAQFLAATNTGKSCPMGQRLVVIGGGSAAMDVARTAQRLGKSVTVLSLEPAGLLPAQATEVAEAREEGIHFVTGAMLQQITEQARDLKLQCVEVDFKIADRHGDADKNNHNPGTFTVTPKSEAAFTLTADAIIPAIGQDADYAIWGDLFPTRGQVLATGIDWQTGHAGIYAGGDLASTKRFVTQAVGMGNQAAAAIARSLLGQTPVTDKRPIKAVDMDTINTYYYPKQPRNSQQNLAVAQRLQNFSEVQQPLQAAQASAEAARCFSCGTCIYCDNCYAVCPDMAITKLDRGYEVKSGYCKGCGLCVAECPTGSIAMHNEHDGASR